MLKYSVEIGTGEKLVQGFWIRTLISLLNMCNDWNVIYTFLAHFAPTIGFIFIGKISQFCYGKRTTTINLSLTAEHYVY